jgi:hypothetical protein
MYIASIVRMRVLASIAPSVRNKDYVPCRPATVRRRTDRSHEPSYGRAADRPSGEKDEPMDGFTTTRNGVSVAEVPEVQAVAEAAAWLLHMDCARLSDNGASARAV